MNVFSCLGRSLVSAALFTAVAMAAYAVPARSAESPSSVKKAASASTNPYAGSAEAIAQGKNLFTSKSCSGCHGAGGGGGMGPPVINDIWVYGSDDATLFELIKLGSVDFRAKGHERTGHESVVGDMPAMGSIASDDEIWKMIAFMRSAASSGK